MQEKQYNFTLALIIGTLGGFLLFVLVTQGFPIPENQKNLGFIYHYQNLIAGLVAASAAGATVLAIFRQISQQEIHRQDDLKRKLSVYRAYMPDALSELMTMTAQYAIYLDDLRNQRTPNSEPWNISSEHIKVLKDSLEYLEGDTSKHILETVVLYQIHRSRFMSLISDNEFNYNTNELIYDTIKLHRYLARIFEFGRMSESSIEHRDNTNAEMQSSKHQLLGYVFFGQDTDLDALILERHPIT